MDAPRRAPSQIAARAYRSVVGRRRFQRAFETLLDLSLRGMNFVGTDVARSGELSALAHVAATVDLRQPVVLDIGANHGDYARAATAAFGPAATVYAFEPASAAFEHLVEVAGAVPQIVPVRLALSDASGDVELYADEPGSGLASLIDRDLTHVGLEMKHVERVAASTLDAFCASRGIDRVALVKVDVEGAELAVLRGAGQMLERDAIDFIQFEFGGTAIDSRIYLRDFFHLLHPRFRIHRVLQDGLRELPEYQERHEIFRTVNYLAERRTLRRS